MSKSIIIFGKGPSVSRCTREFVDQYDDIVICNYPFLNDFFKDLIKDREILYHFANCSTFDERYTNEVNNNLKIKNIINTNKPPNHYANFLRNTILIRESIRESMINKFKPFDLDPNTGTMALQYVLDSKQYNKIALIGFDNFKMGEQTYYFKPNDYNDKMKIYTRDGNITSDGRFNIISGHDPDKTKLYYEYVFKNNTDINFELITNMTFEENYSNVKIY